MEELDELNALSKRVIDSIYQVHKVLGPGLLEKAYQKCLSVELSSRGIKNDLEVELPLIYKNIDVEVNYRIDILVEDKIVLELKAVEKALPIHEAQLLTYLKLSNNKLGFLVNFNVKYIKEGIKRMMN
ncbi:GxxExxY protein [bacterium]|nr:GxxExxY protein [bacterium]